MNVTVMDRQADTSSQTQARHRRLRRAPLHEVARRPRPVPVGALAQASRSRSAAVSRSPFSNAPNYPRMSPFTGMRMDSYPKDGDASRLRPGDDAGAVARSVQRLLRPDDAAARPRLRRAQCRVRRGDGDRGERVGSAGVVRPRAAPEGRRADPAGIHRSRDQGDREARRRPPLHPRDDPAARAGAAGPPPLLADPRSLRRERLLRSRCISAAPAAIRPPAAAGRRSITRSIRPIRRARKRWSPLW